MRRVARASVCSLLTVLLVNWQVRAQQPEAAPTAGELLAHYEAFLKRYRRFDLEYTSRVYLKKEADLAIPEKPTLEQRMRFLRDGDLWHAWESDSPRDVFQWYERDFIVPRVGMLIVQLGLEREPLSVLAFQEPLKPEERNISLGFLEPVTRGLLDYNHDGPDLLAICRDSTLSSSTQQIDGRAMWVLSSRGGWGEHSIWLSPTEGHVPRRITQSKNANHLIAPKRKLSALLSHDGKSTTSEVRQSFEIAVRPQGGDWVPEQVVTQQDVTYTNLRVQQKKVISQVTKIDFNPNFDAIDIAKPLIEIPNETRVYVQENLQIHYVWRGGKIVPLTNDEAVRALERQEFQKSRRPFGPGFYALCGVAAALGLLALLLYRRRLRQRREAA